MSTNADKIQSRLLTNRIIKIFPKNFIEYYTEQTCGGGLSVLRSLENNSAGH